MEGYRSKWKKRVLQGPEIKNIYFQEIFQELYNLNPGVCGNVDKHIQQEINQEYLPFEQIQGQYAEGCSLHSSGTALLDSVQFAP